MSPGGHRVSGTPWVVAGRCPARRRQLLFLVARGVPLGDSPEGLEAGGGDGQQPRCRRVKRNPTWDLDEVVSHPIGRLAALGGPAPPPGRRWSACSEMTLSLGQYLFPIGGVSRRSQLGIGGDSSVGCIILTRACQSDSLFS
jgi:hypothetical protein